MKNLSLNVDYFYDTVLTFAFKSRLYEKKVIFFKTLLVNISFKMTLFTLICIINNLFDLL